MGEKYRVLIVDDQLEARRVLKSGVEAIGRDIEVVDVPSGEEALLEFSLKPFDLLIADVRLAGMTGLELTFFLRQRFPALRTILVTGVEDPKVRQQVFDAGTDYYFLKPLDMTAYMNAVEECLTRKKTALEESEEEGEPPNLSERLTRLRVDTKALAVVLLDEHGEPVAQAGNLPIQNAESTIIPHIMSVVAAGNKVSQILGEREIPAVHYFGGKEFDLFLARVDTAYALLLCVEHAIVDEGLETLLSIMTEAVGDVQVALQAIGVMNVPSPQTVQASEEEDLEEIDEEVDESLLELFEREKGAKVDKSQAESFWEDLTRDTGEISGTPDALSYEQARQLGLTPDAAEEQEEDGE